MANKCGSNDLDLSLDSVPMKYPGGVRETFYKVGRDELGPRSASFSNGYYYLVCRQSLLLWNCESHHSTGLSAQLALPPSGLLYSVDSVVVYSNGSQRPGMIVISGEGTARHWTDVGSVAYTDSTFELSNEVTLSVQLLEPYTNGKPATFLLTTTSGSLFYVRPSVRGSLEAHKLGSVEAKGLGRRLSSYIFSQNASTRLRVIKSLLCRREQEEVQSEEDMETSAPELVVYVVGSTSIALFSTQSRSVLWNVSVNKLVVPDIRSYFERSCAEVDGLKTVLVDAADYRGGVLLLIAATHDRLPHASLFLGYISGYGYQVPAQLDWFCCTRSNVASDCDFGDESAMFETIHLCVPPFVANSTSNNQSDGISILQLNSVYAVYTPEVLDRAHSNALPLNKMAVLPSSDKLIGFACEDRFCSILLATGGQYRLRLLPRGFEDSSVDDNTLMQLLTDAMSACNNPTLKLVYDPFLKFSCKNIAGASTELRPLLAKSDAEIASIVHSLMQLVSDYYDADSSLEGDLRTKRAVCQRLVLFLRHMNILDRVCKARVLLPTSRESRLGSTLLTESLERVGVAIAVRNWQLLAEEHNAALSCACDQMATKDATVRGDVDFMLGKLSCLHLFPSAVVTCTRHFLDEKPKIADKSDALKLLTLASELLICVASAIDTVRRSTSTIEVPEKSLLWTSNEISEAFLRLCEMVLEYARSAAGKLTQVESSRLRDYVINLVVFHLNECRERVDGHPIIVALYDVGEHKVAVDLAERFKDFKVLVKVCSELDNDIRRDRLEMYKTKFASDDFEIYLCNFYRDRGLTDHLLEQRGDRVDSYLANCESLRWRRELQNGNYEKACHSLNSRADRENTNIDKQKAMYSLAKLSALCSDSDMMDQLRDINRKLNVIRHQECIPKELLVGLFADNPKRALEVDEIIAVNTNVNDDDEDPLAVVDAFLRAVDFVESLAHEGVNDGITAKLVEIWKAAIARDDWSKIVKSDSAKDTIFSYLLSSIVDRDDWTKEAKLSMIPSFDVLSAVIKLGRGEKFVKKSIENAHMKIRDQVVV